MAKINYDTFEEMDAMSNSGEISFFGLSNDGDEALVRIMHDSIADFEIIVAHNMKVGDRYRRINCIRDPREPVDNCPLCKANSQIQQRMFIHMIQYVQSADGKIIPKPVVWERSAGQYAPKLKTLINEYGPLSNSLFKIRRNGKAGSKETTYEILYTNPQIVKPENYPKDETAFANYSALGRVVLDKNFQELNYFLTYGQFPQVAATEATQPASAIPTQAIPQAPTARAQIDSIVEPDFTGNNAQYSAPVGTMPVPNTMPIPNATATPVPPAPVVDATSIPQAPIPQAPIAPTPMAAPGAPEVSVPQRPTRYY